ncbi:anaerobic ribonucleoside-triphosphate reductase activating protein [Candidatus Falkowbacteria bacterium]|nr:anaerobic ribonucleoside-triphosphate reductase activating protein [Candidatus Falkowbacteria bacterium]
MIIGGVQPISLLDYPDKVAAIVFTQGCNFQCRYCYNPMLVRPATAGATNTTGQPAYSLADLWAFLDQRQGRLEAVVITGGEPTLHRDLLEFIAEIKRRGLLVKLDTNGTNSQMVKQLVQDSLIDYLAMDIKAPWDKYDQIMPLPSAVLSHLTKEARATAEWLIAEKPLDYEFRTTVIPELSTALDVQLMAEQLAGARLWYLQKGRLSGDLLDPSLVGGRAYTDAEMAQLLVLAQSKVPTAQVR